MRAPLFILALFAAGSGVSAHGFLSTVTINGNTYNGNNPSGSNNPSVIRKVSNPNPNYGASNRALTCGPDELPASQMADANPGDSMTFSWTGEDYSHWPHNTGPMLTYMASCGSTTCDQFDATQAKWFKIHQVGRQEGSGLWYQQALYEGGVDNVTIPSNLAPGNYLIRHEIIALHLATQRGMAEFYPACSQLRIGGTQTGKPTDSELVSLPGAYSDDDPGIYDPSVYDPGASYVFPGPPVAAFVGGSTGGSPNSTTNPSPTHTGSSSPTPASGKVCKLKKRAVSSLEARHFSRAIHRMVFPWSH
jgi:hypothetical protein